MRSAVHDVLPPQVRRSLAKFGSDLGLARRKRGLTAQMMAERVGVARATFDRVEHGDPSVAVGVYAMAAFVLGLGTPLADLVDARTDEEGLLLEAERLPKRVRPKTKPKAS